MKKKTFLAALALLPVSISATADTFVLKDGSTVEGKVIDETPETYVLEIQVTKSIKDERVIQKSDVEKVSREVPDAKAFEEVSKLLPVPDFQAEDEYLARIATVNKFLKDHPQSTNVSKAKEILATLKAEAGELAAGGIKSGGRILSPQDYRPNAYELDARVMEAKIRALIADNHTIAALRQFSEFEKDYRMTLPFGALKGPMTQLMNSYLAEARHNLETLDARTKQRNVGLDRMTRENRLVAEKAITEENAALEARLKSEKDAKVGWVTPAPFSKPVLEEAVRFAEAETKRIVAIQIELGMDAGKVYRDLYQAVNGNGDAAAVSAAVSAAKGAAIPPRYITPLEESAKDRK